MKILYRYIIKNFSKVFIFISLAFIPIGIASELFRQKEFYMKYKTPFHLMLLHLGLNVPCWFTQALPIITLIALLFSLGDISKKNEITAIKAAGINIWKIILLFLIAGLIIGTAELGAREFIIPKTYECNRKIQKEKIQKEKIQKATEFSNLIFFMPNGTRFTVEYLNTDKKIMRGIVIEKYNNDSSMEYLILSKEAIWENSIWLLKNGVIRKFNNDTWSEIYFKNHKLDVHIKPTDTIIQTISHNSMDTLTLKKYIKNLRISGQTTIRERIALNMRYASVFSHIVVMIIGIPFVIGPGRKLNKVLGFTLALIAAFIYWGTQAITISLGENLILHPFIAAWLPIFIFTIIGVYILIKTRK
ncbi:MAG: LptF/LptG family permease [Endomicrobium sp.]|jgi:lipopolysaccharide export system permease protein|nr:LptF/LptG family permease [Endomicrobium sp.]